MEKLRPKRLWAFNETVQPVRKWAWNPDLFTLRVGATALQKGANTHYEVYTNGASGAQCHLGGLQYELWLLELLRWSPWLCFMPHCSPHPRRKLLRQEAPRDWTVPSLPTIPSNGVSSKVIGFVHTPPSLLSFNIPLRAPSLCPWGSLALSCHPSLIRL